LELKLYVLEFRLFLEATTEKVVKCLRKKSAPQKKSWLRLCCYIYRIAYDKPSDVGEFKRRALDI